MHADCLVVFTTLPTEDAARTLVTDLLSQRLIACGTVLPGGTSIYRWEGQVQTAAEALVMLKLPSANWNALEARVRERHPYDVPELLAVPVVLGHQPYLSWVAAEAGAR